MNIIGTDVQKAAAILRSGGIVAIPTETVYGLAANAFDAAAVARIFEVKNRPTFDPLIVHIASADTLASVVRSVPDWAQVLSEHFWPGPLTVVLPKRQIIPDIVTAGLDTVGVRVPNHALTLELLEQLPFPLAAPSANPFGYISPTSAQHVADQLADTVDYILDGGECRVGVESTIVGELEGRSSVFRLGGVALEQLEPYLGTLDVRPGSDSLPVGPGMLASHYAPHKSVVIAAPPTNCDSRTGYLGFSATSPYLPPENQRILSEKADLREAARAVFAALRELDQLDVDVIYAELVPERGLGRAINDRLRRASADRVAESS
ncbi:MAG: threonylcarbamoyl-AMP synthase [Bacteroidetes bacterium]|nr:threonylcarbamoyl-AMP synthase [Bacteroidota bacterium]